MSVCVGVGLWGLGAIPLAFCSPPRKERTPSPPVGSPPTRPWWPPNAVNPTRPWHASCTERSNHPGSATGWEGTSHRSVPGPPSPIAPPPGSRGRADGGCRPSCLLPAPAAAASVPGRRRRRLERVAGPDGGVAGALETPPCGNPARGLCVLSNYLFIEKKGGEKKKKSHVRVIRMRREAAEGGKN